MNPVSPGTVANAAHEWLTRAETGEILTHTGKRFKPSALYGYKLTIHSKILPRFGHLGLGDLTTPMLQDYHDELRATWSRSTVTNRLAPLRAIYRFALDAGWLTSDPFRDLKRDPEPSTSRRDKFISESDALKLLDALSAHGDHLERALWATATFGGLRRRELLAVRWRVVDLKNDTFEVVKALDAHKGARLTITQGARNRAVKVGPQCGVELERWRLRSGRSGAALVFGRTADEPFLPASVRRRALRAWEAAGLHPIGLDDARKMFAKSTSRHASAWAVAANMGYENKARWVEQSPDDREGLPDALAKRRERRAQKDPFAAAVVTIRDLVAVVDHAPTNTLAQRRAAEECAGALRMALDAARVAQATAA
jgi:integrase